MDAEKNTQITNAIWEFETYARYRIPWQTDAYGEMPAEWMNILEQGALFIAAVAAVDLDNVDEAAQLLADAVPEMPRTGRSKFVGPPRFITHEDGIKAAGDAIAEYLERIKPHLSGMFESSAQTAEMLRKK